MADDRNYSLFTPQGKYFSFITLKKNTNLAFKNHPQFPLLIDILSRKYNHNALLYAEFSARMYQSLFEALYQYLSTETVSAHLRDAEFIQIHTENFDFSTTEQSMLENDFQYLRDKFAAADRYLIFIFTDSKFLTRGDKEMYADFFVKQIESLLHHPKSRFLVLTNNKDDLLAPRLQSSFSFLPLTGPTEVDTFTLLKQQRIDLENFHHVIIPDDLLTQAYGLAERYLSTKDTLEKTLLLLDSSAARASTHSELEQSQTSKPILTIHLLTFVLSNWTQIPATHLQLAKFKLPDFMQDMQKRIFGQEAALSIIGKELQSAQAHLEPKTGPFCSFLFAGADHVGKRTTALVLAEQLFKQLTPFYFAQIGAPVFRSFAEINLQRCTDNHYFSLKQVINETPYAIIMFENIDEATPAILDGLQEILTTGYLHDQEGNQYSFRQAIIILSTTLGAKRLSAIAQSLSRDEQLQSADLMHLVMREKNSNVFSSYKQFSPLELAAEIAPEITSYLPTSLCNQLQIVPFLPLSASSIEQIIHLKLKILVKQLDMRYGVELGYAPEIIHFLANDVITKQEREKHSIDIDKALHQLYFCIEQAIVGQHSDNQKSKQLFLQLNETGQLLKCEWIVRAPMRHIT